VNKKIRGKMKKITQETMDKFRNSVGSYIVLREEGDSVNVKFKSPFYEIEQGEEDLLGATSKFGGNQAKVLDINSGGERVLTANISLLRTISNALYDNELTVDDMEGLTMKITRGKKVDRSVDFDVEIAKQKKEINYEQEVIQLVKDEGQLKYEVLIPAMRFTYNLTEKVSKEEMAKIVDGVIESSPHLKKEGDKVIYLV
jgi:hypothetical protein